MKKLRTIFFGLLLLIVWCEVAWIFTSLIATHYYMSKVPFDSDPASLNVTQEFSCQSQFNVPEGQSNSYMTILGNGAGINVTTAHDDIIMGSGSGSDITTQSGWIVFGNEKFKMTPEELKAYRHAVKYIWCKPDQIPK